MPTDFNKIKFKAINRRKSKNRKKERDDIDDAISDIESEICTTDISEELEKGSEDQINENDAHKQKKPVKHSANLDKASPVTRSQAAKNVSTEIEDDDDDDAEVLLLECLENEISTTMLSRHPETDQNNDVWITLDEISDMPKSIDEVKGTDRNLDTKRTKIDEEEDILLESLEQDILSEHNTTTLQKEIKNDILDLNNPDIDLYAVFLNLSEGDVSILKKIKSLPGIFYVIIIVGENRRNSLDFDCCLCEPGRVSSCRKLADHLRSRKHLINCLKLRNPALLEHYEREPTAMLAKHLCELYVGDNITENNITIAENKLQYSKGKSTICSCISRLTVQHEENSRFEAQKVNTSEGTLLKLNTKKFDKIVVITTPEFSIYMENFVNSKVSVFCVTAGNLNNIATAVKCRKKFEPVRTLWLTHPEVFGIDCNEKSDMCISCKEPLEIHILPSMHNTTYSNYANRIQSSFDELIKKVNSFLSAESSFAVLPPFPPSFLPLEETEHNLYHKTGKGRKTYYITTSSALIGFESLYAELSKQMIPFSLTEFKKVNISCCSLVEYLKVVKSWNSYLHVETLTDDLQSEVYRNAKYNQWFTHINQLFSDSLRSTCDDSSVKLKGEEMGTKPKSVCLEDTSISSEIRDDISDILGQLLDEESAFAEDSDSEIIILDSSSKTEELIISGNFDRIVFICFCKAHAQLIREQERSKDVSVVVVKSTLNWCEEKGKFDIFARSYKAVLFIVVGSINLLGKEYPEPFCESEECTDPLICLDLCLFSYSDIGNIVIQKYKKFMNNLRDHFKKVTTQFMFTSVQPVKCLVKSPINDESTHQELHNMLTNTSVYFLKGGKKKWSTMANDFQRCEYIKMLAQGHDMIEEEILCNIIKDFKEPSIFPICWLQPSNIKGNGTPNYNEAKLGLLFQKIIEAACPSRKLKRKTIESSPARNNNSDLNRGNSASQEKRKRVTVEDSKRVNYILSAANSGPDLLGVVAESSYSMIETVDSRTIQPISENSQKDDVCHLKILLENVIAKELVGVDGKTIRKLQEDTNSEVKISKEFEHFPSTDKRVCLIAGSPKAVLRALMFFIDINVNESARVEAVVPDTTAKLIMGEIEQIRKRSRAIVQFYEKEDYPSRSESLFIVRSPKSFLIKTAFKLILNFIALDPENGACRNVAYPCVKSPASKSESKDLARKDSSFSTKKEIVNSKTSKPSPESSRKDKICHLKILLEGYVTDIIVGINGDPIKKLQYTNSKVTFSKEFEYFPGTTQRVCSIKGAEDAVSKVLFIIIDLKKANAPRGSDVKMEFVVPDSTATYIIGEKDKNIQQIKSRSKAYMRMYKKKDYPSRKESCFIISSYDMENIKKAFSLILPHIALDSENGSCSNISYPQVLPDSSSDESKGNDKNLALAADTSHDLKKETGTKADGLTRERSKEPKMCHFKVLLESDIVNGAFNDNVEALQKLQKDTEATVKVSKEFEYFPGTRKRVCLIAGTADSVLKWLAFIIDIERAIAYSGIEMQMEFVVPDSTARQIIGDRRENIRLLKMKSEVFIRECNKKDYPSPNETCFVARSIGKEIIKSALSIILEYVSLDPENGCCSDVAYRNADLRASLPIKDSSLNARKQFIDSEISRLQDNSEENKKCYIKILLQSDIAKAVIGDREEVLQKLREDTNSNVTISTEFEYFPGTTERVCSLVGAADAVLKAIFFIIDVQKVNAPRGSEVKIEFVVPDSTAKQIIGEKKENLQQIKEKSKAYVRMYDKKHYPSPNESSFTVRSFEVEYVRTAFSQILEYIALDPQNGSCSNVTYPIIVSSSSFNISPKNKDSSQQLKKKVENSRTLLPTPEACRGKDISIKILVSDSLARDIIGRNGGTKLVLMRDTNSIIKISDKSSYFPGTNKQICFISGNVDAVSKALFRIIDLSACKIRAIFEISVEFAVPDATARLIIGNRRENIQRIIEKSRAHLQAYNKDKYPSLTDSCFGVISDKVENVKSAFSLILECISLDAENDTRSNMTSHNPNLPSSSSYEVYKENETRSNMTSRNVNLPSSSSYEAHKENDTRSNMTSHNANLPSSSSYEAHKENDTRSNITSHNVNLPSSSSYEAHKDYSSQHLNKEKGSSKTSLLTLQSKKNNLCSIKILLESFYVGRVIGPGGENRRTLEKDTNSRFTISRKSEYFPGTNERTCIVAGTADAVLKAVCSLIDIKRPKAVRVVEMLMKFAVSDSTARLIIGNRGENIQQIMEKSQAHLKAYDKENFPSPNESCFGVRSDNVENIKSAFSLILECISLDAENDTRSNMTSHNDNLPSSSSYEVHKGGNYGMSSTTAAYQESPSKNYEDKMNKNYISRAGGSSHYNYEYPDQMASDHPYKQRVSEYTGNKATGFAVSPDQLENYSEKQRVSNYESRSRVASGYHNTDGNQAVSRDQLENYSEKQRVSNYESRSRVASGYHNTDGNQAVSRDQLENYSDKQRVSNYESRNRVASGYHNTDGNQIVSPDQLENYSEKQRVSNYESRSQVASGYHNTDGNQVVSRDQLENYSEKQRVSNYESRSQGARGYHNTDGNQVTSHSHTSNSEYKYDPLAGASRQHSSVGNRSPLQSSYKNRSYDDRSQEWQLRSASPTHRLSRYSPRKRLHSDSRSEDHRPQSPHKRSRLDVGSEGKDYIWNAGRSNSRSRLDSRSGEYRSRYDQNAPPIYDKSIHHDNEINQEFSVIDTLNLLESVRDKCGSLSKMIKYFTTNIRSELEVDKSNALRLIKNDDVFLEMIITKLKSCVAYTPSEEIILSKAVEWTTYLIQYAEKAETLTRDSNLRAVTYSTSDAPRDLEYRSRYRSSPSRTASISRYRSSPSRTDDKFLRQDNVKILDDFSVIGALNLLERVCDKCGVLSGTIKGFIISVKSELKFDRSKALRLIGEDNNIQLLRMITNKLEFCAASAPLEEIGMLSKALEWINYLIEYVKKANNAEKNINRSTYLRSPPRARSRSASREREWHSQYRNNPYKTDDIASQFDIKKIGDEFSISGALNLLERVCEKRGPLSEMIRAFTTNIRSELEVDRSKALRLIKEDNNILLSMIVNELKSRIASAPFEDIGMLSKAVEWTKELIECADKADKPGSNINFVAIAKASLNKPPDFMINLIKSAFMYEGKLSPSAEDIHEAFVKVSSLQSELVLDYI